MTSMLIGCVVVFVVAALRDIHGAVRARRRVEVAVTEACARFDQQRESR